MVEVLVRQNKLDATCEIATSLGGKTTALHLAVAGHHHAIIRILVAQGAAITPKQHQITAAACQRFPPAVLVWNRWLDAIESDHNPQAIFEVLETLCLLGWNVHTPVDSVGSTILHYVVGLPNEKAPLRFALTEFLLRNGASVLSASQSGCIPLHSCVWSDSPDIAELLLSHQPEQQVIAADSDKNTALHFACSSRKARGTYHGMSMLNVLIRAGADPNSIDRFGQTPMDIAHPRGDKSKHNDREAVDLLRRYGGRYAKRPGQ
jgi:ankyrin repeat protein